MQPRQNDYRALHFLLTHFKVQTEEPNGLYWKDWYHEFENEDAFAFVRFILGGDLLSQERIRRALDLTYAGDPFGDSCDVEYQISSQKDFEELATENLAHYSNAISRAIRFDKNTETILSKSDSQIDLHHYSVVFNEREVAISSCARSGDEESVTHFYIRAVEGDTGSNAKIFLILHTSPPKRL